MKTLYTKSQFNSSSSRQSLPLLCKYCNSTFYLPKNEILKVIASKTTYRSNEYCSNKCKHEDQKIERKTFTCSNCNTLFQRRSKEVKSKNAFCSKSCSATYNNLHKTKGTRCSKLEKWLHKLLPNKYPSLKFLFNDKTTIDSELDIYIPSLNLAFELNGIYHYEPIHGQTKLTQVKSNDKRKFQACIEHSIELCIIDTSQLSYFKEQNAKKYLDIICSIIEQKLDS